MGEFDLQFAFNGLSPLGENIEDQLGSVDDLDFELIRNGTDLRRIQFLVEYNQGGTLGKCQQADIFKLSPPSEKARVLAVNVDSGMDLAASWAWLA